MASNEPSIFTVGDLLVDLDRARVTRAGAEIPLPRLSFDLFLVLVDASPRVVSLDELMQRVWPKLVVSPETVSQRVKLLRRALDDDPESPRYIAGVRGRGYRLVPSVERGPTSQPVQGGPVASGTSTANAPEREESSLVVGAEPRQTVHERLRRRSALLAIGGLVVAGLAVAVGVGLLRKSTFDASKPTSEASSPEVVAGLHPSIAVLPFDNRSDQGKDAFFVDGIHDDILTQLTKIGAFKVIARTSVEQFRNTKLTTREIGTRLGVDTVVEGGVQRAGNRVRVNVQLIDAASDTQLWAERYDRELSAANIFAIQTEVAAAIATELKATLTPAYRARARVAPTRSLEAWEAYQLGRQRMVRRTSEALAQAAEFFRRAIRSDPAFALAHAAQAENALLQIEYSGNSFDEGFETARAAVDRALALDPALAEAVTMNACLLAIDEVPDLDRSEAQYRLAMKLNPNYATALHWYSGLLAVRGRWEEALTFAEKAKAVDPLSAPVNLDVGVAQERLGRFDEALRSFQRVVEIDPSMPAPYMRIAMVQAFGFGRMDLAMPWSEKALALDPGSPILTLLLGNIHWHLGGHHDRIARRLFEQVEKRGIPGAWANAFLAMQFLAAGKPAEARRHAIEGYRVVASDWAVLRAMRDIDLEEGNIGAARERYSKAVPGLIDDALPQVNYGTFGTAVDLAYVLQRSGEIDRATALLDQAERFIAGKTRLGLGGTGIVDAQIHAMRGEPAKALAAIRSAVQAGWRVDWRYYRDVDPILASIRNEPAFKAVFADIERDMAQQRAALAARPREAPLDLAVAP